MQRARGENYQNKKNKQGKHNQRLLSCMLHCGMSGSMRFGFKDVMKSSRVLKLL